MICTEAIPASPIRDRTFRLIKRFIGAARTAVGQHWNFLLLGLKHEDETDKKSLLVKNLNGARKVG
jgi:hypothetical protein